MKVELISYSNIGEKVCGIASKTCVSKNIPGVDDDVSKSLKSAMSSYHMGILEHFTMTFAVSGVSRALTHQLVRHRLASYSQQSQRYVNMDEFEYVIPKSIEGASDDVYNEYLSLMDAIDKTYQSFIERGIPEQDARYILPNACCTNIVITVNARELRHMAEERMCARAQEEIRQLVTELVRQAKEVAPTIFADAGPKCLKTHVCRERNGCGRYPKHVVIE